MNNFNWEDFKKGNIQVNCKNQESAKDFLSKCAKQNIKWNDDTEIDSKDTYWEYEKQNMMYSIYRKSESDIFSKSGRLYYGNTKNQDKQFIEWIIGERSDTQVELFKDDKGEYIDLKLIKENHRLNIQFYIEESNVIPSRVYNDFKGIVCSDGKITFKLKQATLNPIKKKMTKEEVEKELGYKIEIVEE